MFSFWFHEMPVIWRLSATLTATRWLLIVSYRWRRLTALFLESPVWCAIMDLVLGVAGGGWEGPLVCFACCSFFATVAHELGGVGAGGGADEPPWVVWGLGGLFYFCLPPLLLLLLVLLLLFWVVFVCVGVCLLKVRWIESTFLITTVLRAAMEALIWLAMLEINFIRSLIPWLMAPFCCISISLTFAWLLAGCCVRLGGGASFCWLASGHFGVPNPFWEERRFGSQAV